MKTMQKLISIQKNNEYLDIYYNEGIIEIIYFDLDKLEIKKLRRTTMARLEKDLNWIDEELRKLERGVLR